MNKKTTIVLGLALILMISIASLAYFTDIKSGKSNVTAGNVSFNDSTVAVDTDFMVPSDKKTLQLSAEYTGNVDAKVRVKLSGLVESEEATDTEGFKLKNREEIIDLSKDAFINAPDVSSSSTTISLPLTIELLAASTNKYQDETFSVDYQIQVLQAEHTNWTAVDDGTINIEDGSIVVE